MALDSFPIPVARFVKLLQHTEDEVWSKLLIKTHGKKCVIETEWRDLLAKLKSE
jgi:hypothetical protein